MMSTLGMTSITREHRLLAVVGALRERTPDVEHLEHHQHARLLRQRALAVQQPIRLQRVEQHVQTRDVSARLAPSNIHMAQCRQVTFLLSYTTN